MPGDICFNCGRVSTLLVTPRPPRKSLEKRTKATADLVLSQERPVLGSKAFDSQYDQIEALLTATAKLAQQRPQYRAFDSQLTEIDDLLSARRNLAHVHALAANDMALLSDRGSNPFNGCFSGRLSDSSTAHSSGSSGSLSKTLRSDSDAVSEDLSEGGRPYEHVVSRWLETEKLSGRSEAKLTRRGVDCRLNLAGRSCEWVIFL